MSSLDDLLSAAGRVDDLTAEGRRRGGVALAAASAAHDSAASAAPRPPRRRARHSLRYTLAVAGVAAVACAAAITVPAFIGGGAPGADAAAATVLRAAGHAAGEQSGGWPDAAYWRVTSVYQRGGTTYQREIWVSHHGQSVLSDNGVSAGILPLGPGLFPAGGTALTWDQLYALPTDPGLLTAELQADINGAGPDPTSELFTIVGDLLRESPAPPALREALYDVAAGIPGVHLIGHVKDALGRTGTGVRRNGETLVIDPSDGVLLAETEENFSTAYISQGPVATAPKPTAAG